MHTHYIDGAWTKAQGGEAVIEVVNPATSRPVGAVLAGDSHDVERAVQAARRAFPTWSATPVSQRIQAIRSLCTELDTHRERLAATLSAEMGSPISFARQAQVGVAIADLEALIGAAGDLPVSTSVSRSLVVTEPVGVVAAITPWNFPLHQIALKVGAALLAGCTVVLKPSEVAPLNAAVLAELLDQLPLPPGTFNLVFGDGVSVGEPLCAHPDVDEERRVHHQEGGARTRRQIRRDRPRRRRHGFRGRGRRPFVLRQHRTDLRRTDPAAGSQNEPGTMARRDGGRREALATR
jgi:acyl-CoA reductase-like NAD-dependent aldehyde dehydrogenase